MVTADYQGKHNSDLINSNLRLQVSNSYQDLSTICIIPNNGLINAKVAENWLYQTSQMNQKFVRLMMIGMEKNHGFNTCIEQILATPGLNAFKYILTLEEDITSPIDGLMKLFENIGKYDVVGGLAWTKGIEGRPMLYGHPKMVPASFTVVEPQFETVQECLGIGTGYTLFKMAIFKDPRIPKPWFRKSVTNQAIDLSFFDTIHKLGYRTACDTRVRLGHYEIEDDIVW